MTEQNVFERQLAEALQAFAAEVPTDVRPADFATSIALAHHRGSALAALFAGRRRAVWLVVAALALALFAAILAGQRAPEPRPGWMAFSRGGDVFLSDGDGSSAVLAIDEDLPFSVLGWSPDGRWLAVEAGRTLYTLDAMTLELHRLPVELTWWSFGGWSPDSSSIVYEVFDATGSEQGSRSIWIVDRETGATRELAGGRGSCLPVFSRDGRSIAAVSDSSLVIIDVATGSRDVASTELIGDGCLWTAAKDAPSWSSDSQRLAFVTGGEGSGPRTIVVVRRDGTIDVRVPGTGADRPVAFSPDGTWIAFPEQTGGLAVIGPDGRDERVLVPDGVDRRWIRWSADGTRIDLGRPADGDGLCGCELWTVDVATGAFERLEAAGNDVDTYARRPPPSDGTVESLPPGIAPEAAATKTPTPAATVEAPIDPSAVATGFAYDVESGRSQGELQVCEAARFGFADRSSTTQQVFCGGPGWSPDASAHAHLAEPAPGTLRVTGRDGSALGSLSLAGEIEPWGTKWSPAGRWLAIRVAGGPFMLAARDGTVVAELSGEPVWSPNEERLAIASADGTLLVGSGDGGDLRPIGEFPGVVAWSPDARRFAYLKDGDVWIADAHGMGARNVTAFGVAAGATTASWSPDGEHIAVPHGDVLWLISPDGDERRWLEFDGDELQGVSWSPDGRHVAVHSRGAEGSDGNVYVVEVENLRTTVLRNAGLPLWSPDGSLLALQPSAPADMTKIVIVRPDGSGRVELVLDRPLAADPVSGQLRWVP